MQELGAMRSARAPLTSARSSFTGGRRLVDRPLVVQAAAPRRSLRCTAVAEVEADVEKRGEGL